MGVDRCTDRRPLRIGFLFNHEALHQVSHTAPIIAPLQRLLPDAQIEVLTSSEEQREAVRAHLDPVNAMPAFWPIQAGNISRLVERLLGGLVPISRISGLAANLDLLRQFDALIVPETTTTILKTRFKLAKPKLIFFPHGAGDRSIGFSPEIAHFDYVLLPGEKTRERMLAAAVIRADNHALVGYPKFDALPVSGQPPTAAQFFDNDRPTVLYNPHFDPRLSSWFTFGEQLLDYFVDQDRYNLIFAPHVMLFKRKLLASIEHRQIKLRNHLSQRYQSVAHIHIDTGSTNSVDMTYTRAADIYVGDVSSQIYEFIARPRPAIFLNSHGADWQGDPNYECWNFGPVVDNLGDFEKALDGLLPMSDHYRAVQQAAFAHSFSLDPNCPSAARAAAAIAEYLAGDSAAAKAQAIAI